MRLVIISFPSKETKKQMSESAKNKQFSLETREKMAKAKNKKVYQYDKEGNYIDCYSSASLAAKLTKTNVGNLCACCRNIVKTAGGYFWSYQQINEPSKIIDHINGINEFIPVFTRNEKPVYKLSLNDEIISSYASIKEASKDTGIPAQEISQACKNNNKVTRRYKWKYAS